MIVLPSQVREDETAKGEADAAAGRAAPPGRPSRAIYRADELQKRGLGNAAGEAGPLVSLPYLHAQTPDKPRSRLVVYPDGVHLEDVVKPSPKAPEGVPQRGAIEGFSARSASRLRAFSMTYQVPSYFRFSATLTHHRNPPPDEWRHMMQAMNMRFIRHKWASVWRIELQRRGTPHLHNAVWCPIGRTDEEQEWAYDWLRNSWLEVSGQKGDLAAWRHSVKWKPIRDGGWAVYQALHDTKHKQEQQGWKGKQWGFWNKSLFKPVEAEFADLDDEADREFRTVLNLYLQARGARMRVPQSGTFQRMGEAWDIKQLYWWALEATR